MTRSMLIAAGISLAAFLWVLTGVFLPSTPSPVGEAEAPVARPPAVRVIPSSASPRIGSLVIKGRTQAFRNVPVRAETTGKVVALGEAKGGPIKEGGLILRLSTDDRKAKLDEAKALVAQHQIQYNASVKLEKKSFTPKIRVSETLAQLQAAQSALSLARLEMDRAKLTASFAGTLTDRMVEVGDWVKTGDIVARVATLDPMKIVGAVTEKNIGDLKTEAPAVATLIDGRKIEGQITFVSSVADPQTRTFALEMTAANPDGAIQEGLTAVLRLPLKETLAHEIPPACLTMDPDGSIGVKTVEEGDVVRFYPVAIIGEGVGGFWVTGLPAMARVITVGQDFVSAGQVVTPQEAPSAEAPPQ